MKDTDIKAFLAVAEFGSMTRAADALYLNQSTLSLRIQALEEELDVVLFARSKGIRQVRLTPEGERFLRMAREWDSLWEKTLKTIHGDEVREMKIACIHSYNSFIINEVTADFVRQHPDIRMKIISNRSRGCYQAVENNEVEAAVVPLSLYYSSLSVVPIFSEPFVLLAKSTSGYEDGIHPSDLDISKNVYLEWDHGHAGWHTHWFGERPQHRLFTDNMHLASAALLREKETWSVVPLTIASILSENSDLGFVSLKEAPKPHVAHLVTKRNVANSEALSEYLEKLSETVTARGASWEFDFD